MINNIWQNIKNFTKKYINKTYMIIAGVFVLLCCLLIIIFSSPNNIPNLAMDEIVNMSSNIHNNFKAKPDYWGLSTEYVIDNKLADEKMIKEKKLVSVTGNEVVVGNTEDGFIAMPGSHSFDIVYKNLSRRYCVILSSYHMDYAEKIGLLNITIKNKSSEATFAWGSDGNKLPISVAEAKKHCLSNENTIIWTFK